MNLSSRNTRRIVAQQGAILPVVLLLGMGLMIGIAGVVNLGFVQDDLAKAERAAIDSAIATQFLTDYQQFEIGRLGAPSGARLPFPTDPAVSGTFHTSFSDANLSCFATGASASNELEYVSRGFGNWGDGLFTPFTLGQVVPVSANQKIIPEISDTNAFFLTEYGGRDIHYLTVPSAAGHIELRRLGETDVDRFFAHIWFRLPAFSSMGDFGHPNYGSVAVPLLTHSSSATAIPKIQWIARASGIPGMPDIAVNRSGSEDTVDMYLEMVINSGGTGIVASSASQLRSDRLEWHAASIWYDGPNNSVWTQVRHRGVSAASAPAGQLASGPTGLTINRNGRFDLGNRSAQPTPGAFINAASGINAASSSFDIATVRVWLEPSGITTASNAESVADGLFEMDTYRPGDWFVMDTSPGDLPFNLGEPDSYITLDSDQALVALSGSERLITSDWQPIFGQPVAINVQLGTSSPAQIGGNPDSYERLEHGGPPSSTHYYVYHSCDENGYQFVERVRRFTRGAGTDDQQVEWFEE